MDITFWLPADYESNNFYDFVRTMAGDLVENVNLIDDFTHPKTSRRSHCYRITYRSMDRVLTVKEINEIQERIRQQVGTELNVEVR